MHDGSVPPAGAAVIGGFAYPGCRSCARLVRVETRSLRPMVGRARERAVLDGALEAGRAAVIVLRGEPGIGKSRLLGHLAERAEAAGACVLTARASEFEGDLPYALWTEALDPAPAEPADADRHRFHRVLRDRLDGLAATRLLVLCLDDVHWADPASIDALAALVRRPPASPVLVALAARTGVLPAALGGALGDAARDERLLALDLEPLTQVEASELVGDAATGIYARAGGNPFYLEQLARGAEVAPAGRSAVPGDDAVPAPVAAAIAAELAALEPHARRMLDGAAVAGDPFDPALAAAAADLPEPDALQALDALLEPALVRPAGAPRRFAFRHPVVRHTVYVSAPGGWRLGAHDRVARALERQGAGPVQRAHHVEHAASPGDPDAVALLAAAAHELRPLAPAAAAHWLAAALRLVPGDAIELRARLADAQAAAGDPVAARATLLEALRVAAPEERLGLTVALANQEWRLGANEDARRRLHVALGDLPAEPSADRIRLRLALALTALMDSDLAGAQAQCADARDDARAIGDPVFEFAALSCRAVALASAADPAAAGALGASAAALERLTPAQLATRLPGFWMHGRARCALGRFEDAVADLRRGAAIAAETGREGVLLAFAVESVAPLIQLGRIGDAIAAAEEGVELGRLGGNPRTLLWAFCALATARLAAGDVASALRQAEEAAALPTRADFHAAGQPGWCLGASLTAAGNAAQAVPVLLEAFGGPELAHVLPAERPAAAADLVEAHLACGDVAAAEATLAGGASLEAAGGEGGGGAARAEGAARTAGIEGGGGASDAEAAARTAGIEGGGGAADAEGAARTAGSDGGGGAARASTPFAVATTEVARSAVMLAAGRDEEAVRAAAAALAASAGLPLLAARARLAYGRALAATGERAAAIDALDDAEAAFDRFGARRRRDEAVRELRRLGRRVVRASAEPAGDALTAREREIAELVAAGRTNREVAEQLVLSPRTIDAHLRSIYGKLGVRSRVELAGAMQREARA
jgi:DNA-binding NarL/FixJ family response regulator